MSTFDELKAKAQTAVTAEEAKIKSGWAKYWPYVAAAAGLIVCGFIAGKIL